MKNILFGKVNRIEDQRDFRSPLRIRSDGLQRFRSSFAIARRFLGIKGFSIQSNKPPQVSQIHGQCQVFRIILTKNDPMPDGPDTPRQDSHCHPDDLIRANGPGRFTDPERLLDPYVYSHDERRAGREYEQQDGGRNRRIEMVGNADQGGRGRIPVKPVFPVPPVSQARSRSSPSGLPGSVERPRSRYRDLP